MNNEAERDKGKDSEKNVYKSKWENRVERKVRY